MSENITNVSNEVLNNSEYAPDKIWSIVFIAVFLLILYGVGIFAMLKWFRQKNIDLEKARKTNMNTPSNIV